jgi:hypothetical protein
VADIFLMGLLVLLLRRCFGAPWHGFGSVIRAAAGVAGFIMMTPQLFINYKLKSVAHLPWRQMTYKFLNTIIDDLFAFVIKMPLLHRLSVFRDGERSPCGREAPADSLPRLKHLLVDRAPPIQPRTPECPLPICVCMTPSVCWMHVLHIWF